MGSSPPQNPQPSFADFWYLASKTLWPQSSVTSCHFLFTTSRFNTVRDGPPAFTKKYWRNPAGTSLVLYIMSSFEPGLLRSLGRWFPLHPFVRAARGHLRFMRG